MAPKIEKAADTAKAIDVARGVVLSTSVLYPVQFVCATLSIAGLLGWIGVEESWLNYADFFNVFSTSGELVYLTGVAGTVAIGLFELLIAIGSFFWFGVDAWSVKSFILWVFCFVGYYAPGFNLVPWAYVWCFYVVWKQAKD